MALNLKNDIVFKAFFGQKGNEKFLTEFLEAILKIKIEKIEICEEVSLQKLFEDEKGGRLDLLATLNDGLKVDIEMQVKEQRNFLERTSLYSIKENAREIGAGMEFQKIKKTIMINILDFEIFKDIPDFLSESAIVLQNHRNYEIMKNPKWYFIELPKFRKTKSDLNDKLNQWLLFIDDYDKGGIKMVEKQNKTLKEARKKVDYLTGDAEIRRLTELREKWELERLWDEEAARNEGIEQGIEQGIAQGIEQGIEQGIAQEKQNIARELLKNGSDIQLVKNVTNLSIEKIKEIKKELEN